MGGGGTTHKISVPMHGDLISQAEFKKAVEALTAEPYTSYYNDKEYVTLIQKLAQKANSIFINNSMYDDSLKNYFDLNNLCNIIQEMPKDEIKKLTKKEEVYPTRELINTYHCFINRVVRCYNINKISSDECISLLNCILYYQVSQCFSLINNMEVDYYNNYKANRVYVHHLAKGEMFPIRPDHHKGTKYSFDRFLSLIDQTNTYWDNPNTSASYIYEQLDTIIRALATMYITTSESPKLTENELKQLIKNVQDKILNTIIRAICENDKYKNDAGEDCSNEYSKILQDPAAKDRLAEDFRIKTQILYSDGYNDICKKHGFPWPPYADEKWYKSL